MFGLVQDDKYTNVRFVNFFGKIRSVFQFIRVFDLLSLGWLKKLILIWGKIYLKFLKQQQKISY